MNDAEFGPTEDHLIRSAVSDALHEPLPDGVSTLEGVMHVVRMMRAHRDRWGSCHEAHMQAEAELGRIWRIKGPHVPAINRQVRERLAAIQEEQTDGH